MLQTADGSRMASREAERRTSMLAGQRFRQHVPEMFNLLVGAISRTDIALFDWLANMCSGFLASDESCH